jgi:hypothetical protein
MSTLLYSVAECTGIQHRTFVHAENLAIVCLITMLHIGQMSVLCEFDYKVCAATILHLLGAIHLPLAGELGTPMASSECGVQVDTS